MEHVTIIGGGIAGLSIAIALRHCGLAPDVYESATAFKPVGAGIVLAFNAMRACERLGLAQAMHSKGKSVDKMVITNAEGEVLSAMDYNKHRNFFKEVSLSIHRHSLHQVLLGALPADCLHLSKRVKHFTQHTDHVQVTFDDGSTLESRYVIAADGIHSIFRKNLLPKALERYTGYTCWRGIGQLPHTYAYKDQLVESWGKGKRLGIVPLTEGKVYWFAVVNAKENDPNMQRVSKVQLIDMFAEFNAEYISVLQNTPEQQLFWNDLHDINPLDKFAFGNILLAGDAAHATSPNMGQGGCQALEDAAVLMSCLKAAPDIKQAFEAFEKRRLVRTKKVIDTSRNLGKVAQLQNPMLVKLRNWAMKVTPESLALKQMVWLNDTDF